LITSIVNQSAFEQFVIGLNEWIIESFDWLFSIAGFSCVVLVLILFISPISQIKIGGPAAVPLLSRWKWFSITLCTTVATGILLWGAAEPLFHLHDSPEGFDYAPNSPEAAQFAMSTMFMHWTITPYSIYTLAGLLFALMYYNQKRSENISALLYPVLKHHSQGSIGIIMNILCLFALTAGMAASLGSGILTISGGLDRFTPLESSSVLNLYVGVLIVVVFTLSAVSGLQKGIKTLSDFNIKLFIFLALFVFVLGVPWESLILGWNGLIDFIVNFIPRNLLLDDRIDASWSRTWTTFYWANWIAWTPITAIFLGKIARGYTVRQFVIFNLFLPSLFSAFWMIVFSGSAIHHSIAQPELSLFDSMTNEGPESVIYTIIDLIPLGAIIGILFLIIAFLSYVTAADSNTTAMSGICQSDEEASLKSSDNPIVLKIIWGTIIGASAVIMINYAGIDGIKMLSNIGGLPALLLIIMICVGGIRILVYPNIAKYKETKN